MTDKKFTDGLLLLLTGLMTSSISSVIKDFKILGSSGDFAMGFFDGLSVVIFAIAIFLLARSRGSA